MGCRAVGGLLAWQTLNLPMPAATPPPFFFRGLRTREGMRPGLVETELSFAGRQLWPRVVCNVGSAWDRVQAMPSLVEPRSGCEARPLIGGEGGLKSD